jgi:putative addiction module component (TIGR02574 family)
MPFVIICRYRPLAGAGQMSSPSQPLDFSQLTIAERIILVEQIWDSIATEQGAVPLTSAQEAELDRRLEAHRQSPHEGASWEEVKARIQGTR